MHTFNRNTTGEEIVKAFSAQVEGKTILITGPSASSIGASTAMALAHANPSTILLLGRTASKITPVIQRIQTLNPSINVSFVHLDLNSSASVRKAAQEVDARVQKIDILINNAGMLGPVDLELTEDGVEKTFASNHLGHFLLTNLLREKLLAAGPEATVVSVSSTGFMLGGVQFSDANFERRAYGQWRAYAQAKTANVLFSQALGRKSRGRVRSFVVHPGFIRESGFYRDVTEKTWSDMGELVKEVYGEEHKPGSMEEPKSLSEACSTVLVAALDPSLAGEQEGYFMDCASQPIYMDFAKGEENCDKLWELSEVLVKEKFEW